jgi:hypothetical protein
MEISRNNFLVLLIFTIILAGSIFILFSYFASEKEIIPEPPPTTESDNRISPLVNQGIIFEVKRIRHRGLLELIMKPGVQWKQKPVYYFTCEIDGVDFNSRNVNSANLENDDPFQTWDTGFINYKLSKDIKENQTTCQIFFQMWEEEKTGLLGQRTKQTPLDSFSVEYDFKTGRWDSKDDSLYDNDGLGHILGDQFEIWFTIYQTDYDHDYIPYWTEVNILHTDPCESDLYNDPDNDGIPTWWEWKYGYDPFVWDDHAHLDVDIDGIENIEEYQMHDRLSNPFRQDIYIEVDGMEQGGLFDPPHILWDETAQIVIERFADHGINVYFDNGWPNNPSNGGGELLPHHRTISSELGTITQFYKHHFPDERKGIFRYCIIAHSSGFATAPEFNHIDFFSIDTSKEIMWKMTRRAYTERRERVIAASALMHELGHTLGILPWTFEGCDNFSFTPFLTNYKSYEDTWGQYESVMNYFHIYNYDLVDYSDGSNGPPYDQNDWLELYLPTFQKELEVVEDPTIETPATDKVVIKEEQCFPDGWEYNHTLTDDFIRETGNWSPIEPVICRWKVFVRNESIWYPSERTVRIYAQPIFQTTIVQPSYWSLIFEGDLQTDGSIDLGNLGQLIEKKSLP